MLERYCASLRSALKDLCEVEVTQAQLEGFAGSVYARGMRLPEERYFAAEGWILKASFGCVEKQIKLAQARAWAEAKAAID
ncbi:MAG: hypothetical protein LBM28_04650 [Oscillospiraceae bacterium]|jgi:hypothetical protein|nr:hypothetical protein [Oscillospiraceae bacterium]